MSIALKNIQLNFKENTRNNNNLNLTGLNVTEVNDYNNERASPVSDPRAPSPLQSFFQKAKNVTKKVSRVFKRPSSSALSFEQLYATRLYQLYDSYLQDPSPDILRMIQQEVKQLGNKSLIVQSMRAYAEGVFENAAYTKEAKIEKTLVNALGGSTLSSGGRHTQKRKRRSHKKNTRKH
jgi:hypothetical protein